MPVPPPAPGKDAHSLHPEAGGPRPHSPEEEAERPLTCPDPRTQDTAEAIQRVGFALLMHRDPSAHGWGFPKLVGHR